MLALKYLSEPWAQEALIMVENDERVQQAVKGLALSLLIIVLEPPKDCYGFMYVAFDKNGLKDYRVGHDYHTIIKGIDPSFVVSGDYQIFARIQQGQLSERKALITGKIHLTGSLIKALRHMNAMETITAVLREVPCET